MPAALAMQLAAASCAAGAHRFHSSLLATPLRTYPGCRLKQAAQGRCVATEIYMQEAPE